MRGSATSTKGTQSTSAPTGPRIEQALVDDPLLLRTPIVRSEGRATVGFVPDLWKTWLA